jgi:hypothetical protein
MRAPQIAPIVFVDQMRTAIIISQRHNTGVKGESMRKRHGGQ